MSKRHVTGRHTQKKFIVFCEGDTEENYILGFRNWLFENHPDTNVVVDRPINMHGGGYREFYKYVRKSASTNCIARFVIVDFDRCLNNPNEMMGFMQLLEYCRVQTTRKSPCLLIVSNPSFEYAACLHSPCYRSQDPHTFVRQEFGYRSVNELKSDKMLWNRLNEHNNSFETLIDNCSTSQTLVSHSYRKIASSFSIEVKRIEYHMDRQAHKSSNLHEFFDIVLR